MSSGVASNASEKAGAFTEIKYEVQLTRQSSPPSHGQTNSLSLPHQQLADSNQPTLTLNDSRKIPILGLGTWNAQGKELKAAVKSAIYAGYRHIDTASNYKNEHIVGEAILECIEEKAVRRQDLFITTKVWNNSHTRKSVPKALQASLRALNIAYVDLYLIHYPIGYKEGGELSPVDENGMVITSEVDYIETWRGMQDAQQLGMTRSIGVSNFNKQQLRRLIRNSNVVPAINQVECHPYLNQSALLDFCRKHRIALTAYSPLGSPGRVSAGYNTPLLLSDPVVHDIAKRHQISVSQVLIRYQIQRGIVVIPKAVQQDHIISNFDSLSVRLRDDDIQKLDSLNKNYRYMLFERCLGHKFYPFLGTDEEDDETDSCDST